MRKLMISCMFLLFLTIVSSASALSGEQGSFVTDEIGIGAKEGQLHCYSNSTQFNVWCTPKTSSILQFLIVIPKDKPVGFYKLDLLLDQAYSDNGNYTTNNGQFVGTILLTVTEHIEPQPKENETALHEIKISLIGIATRGKMAIIRTTDEDGRAVLATISIADPEGNVQIIQTNAPTKGFGTFKIADDSNVPVALLAFAEGYESGTYLINELKGELLVKPSTPGEGYTLIIEGIPGEYPYNNILNTTRVIRQETGEMIENANIAITDPDNAQLSTHSDKDGTFKIFLGKLGVYRMTASKEGYTPSQEYSVKSRMPRSPLQIRLIKHGEYVDKVYSGEVATIRLLSNGIPITDTITGTINFPQGGEPITFVSGAASYLIKFGRDGIFTVSVSQSENYVESIAQFEALPGFDLGAVATFIGLILLIVIIITVLSIIVWKARKPKHPTDHYELDTGE